jgi:hypothetical protein
LHVVYRKKKEEDIMRSTKDLTVKEIFDQAKRTNACMKPLSIPNPIAEKSRQILNEVGYKRETYRRAH